MDKSKMTDGPIFKTLLAFSLPLVIINIVQLLFHSADVAVLGIMATDTDVAAVGACGSLISLLLCVFSGYSSAANVVIAKRVGAQDVEGARRATGTALVVGFTSGVILMSVTEIFAERFLIMMNCQPDVLPEATRYLRIYFAGMPVIMMYNFVAAILRATGDSVRPMIYMISSGALNVVLNFVFVGFMNMAVAGVALATVLSNLAALAAALIALARNRDYCKVELKNLRFRRAELTEIIKIGVPSCLCGISFYLGEVIVVSAMNSISTDAMTANAVASQLDRFTYSIGSSIAIASGVMVAQNYGAGRLDRVPKIMNTAVSYLTVSIIALSSVLTLFSTAILGIFTDSDAVVHLAKERFILLSFTNFITCSSEVMSNAVRALKRPRSLLVVGLLCGLIMRGGWAYFVWPKLGTIPMLFICFPLSTLVGCVIYSVVYRGAMKEIKGDLTVTD
jgi:putative MATE family efflux protein